jgi:hypothetical protein
MWQYCAFKYWLASTVVPDDCPLSSKPFLLFCCAYWAWVIIDSCALQDNNHCHHHHHYSGWRSRIAPFLFFAFVVGLYFPFQKCSLLLCVQSAPLTHGVQGATRTVLVTLHTLSPATQPTASASVATAGVASTAHGTSTNVRTPAPALLTLIVWTPRAATCATVASITTRQPMERVQVCHY